MQTFFNPSIHPSLIQFRVPGGLWQVEYMLDRLSLTVPYEQALGNCGKKELPAKPVWSRGRTSFKWTQSPWSHQRTVIGFVVVNVRAAFWKKSFYNRKISFLLLCYRSDSPVEMKCSTTFKKKVSHLKMIIHTYKSPCSPQTSST